MKFSILPLLALASVVAAAPVPVADAEASPGYGKYGGYGAYPPPKGGYGKYGGYGTYKRVDESIEKRDYADYGTYKPPPGGYAEYGSYGAVTHPKPVPAPAGGYAKYGDYPAGKYATYGTYKRAISDFVKRLWN